MYNISILRSTTGIVGLVLLSVIFLIAVFAPILSPFDPWDYSSTPLQQPSFVHPLGTNDIGQDILSELLYGTRTSLVFGFSVASVSLFISIVVGVYAAIYGGIIEQILMRIVDVFIAIPPILVMILVAAYLQPNFLQMILIFSILSWQYGARVIYSQTLSLKHRHYIYAAKNFGAGTSYIVIRHLVPDLYPILLAGFIMRARIAVFMEAGLAFIGIFDPTMKSLGLMMHYAMGFVYMGTWLNWLVPPGVVLALAVLGFSLMGHTLEETIDQRHKRIENA